MEQPGRPPPGDERPDRQPPAPGDQRPIGWGATGQRVGGAPVPGVRRAPAPRLAILQAVVVGLLAALAWAALRSILDVTVGALAIAGLGGWGMGSILHRGDRGPWVAAALGCAAWLTGLLLAWLLAMAILPGSSRTLPERLAATPFHEWLAPQLGIVELATLVVFVAAAAWSARRREAPPGDPWG